MKLLTKQATSKARKVQKSWVSAEDSLTDVAQQLPFGNFAPGVANVGIQNHLNRCQSYSNRNRLQSCLAVIFVTFSVLLALIFVIEVLKNSINCVLKFKIFFVYLAISLETNQAGNYLY